MGFNKRNLPADVKVLEDKLSREGSHYFYNMYVKKTDCWMSESNSKSMDFINKFIEKRNETNIEFHRLSET